MLREKLGAQGGPAAEVSRRLHGVSYKDSNVQTLEM